MRWVKPFLGFSVVVAPTAIFGILPLTGLLDETQARWAVLGSVVWFVISALAIGVIALRSSPKPTDNEAYQKGLREGMRIAIEQLRASGPIEVGPQLTARAVGDSLEIRDEATATVTHATVNAAGDVVAEPSSAAPLVEKVLQVFAGLASGTGQAFDATVSALDGPLSPPTSPQSPERSKHE